jgi:hypothetical protein
MSEERQARIDEITARKRAADARQEVVRLLSSITSIRFEGLVDVNEQLIDPWSCWVEILAGAVKPGRKLDDHAFPHEVASWLAIGLNETGVDSEYHVSFGEYAGIVPWARIHVLSHDWLSAVWDVVPTVDLLILSVDSQTIFAVENDVDWYYCYIEKVEAMQAYISSTDEI